MNIPESEYQAVDAHHLVDSMAICAWKSSEQLALLHSVLEEEGQVEPSGCISDPGRRTQMRILSQTSFMEQSEKKEKQNRTTSMNETVQCSLKGLFFHQISI